MMSEPAGILTNAAAGHPYDPSNPPLDFPRCLNGGERLLLAYVLCALRDRDSHFFKPRFFLAVAFLLPMCMLYGKLIIFHYAVLMITLTQLQPRVNSRTKRRRFDWPRGVK